MIKLINGIFVFFALSIILCIATIILDSRNSPSSYARLIPYVEKILSNNNYQIIIKQDMIFKWDSDVKIFNIRLVNLIIYHNKLIYAKIPQINIELPLSSFVPLMHSYKKITLDDPEINLFHNEKLGKLTSLYLQNFNTTLLINNAKLNFKESDQIYSYYCNSNISWSNQKIAINNLELKEKTQILFKLYGIINDQILNFSIEANNILLDDIWKIWPKSVNSNLKTWAYNSISKGLITNSNVEFYIDLNDLKNNKAKGLLNVKGLTLNYYPTLPQIDNIDAKISFGDRNIEVLVHKAKIDHSEVMNANVKIPYNLQSIVISGNSYGAISDLASFIPELQISSYKKYNVNLKQISGESSTQIKNITLFFTENMKLKDIIYDIKADLTKVQLSNLNIKDGNLKLDFNGKIFSLIGNIKLNNLINDIKFQGFTDKNSKHDFILDIYSLISPKDIKNFLFEDIIFKTGAINSKISIYSKDQMIKANISADLTDGEFDIELLNFYKNRGKKLQFNAEADILNEIINIKNSILQGDNIKVSGDYNFSIKNFTLLRAKLDQLKLYKNNIKINYLLDKNIGQINISGAMLDLSKVNFHKIFNQNNDIDRDNYNKKISIDVSAILMKNDVIFSLPNGYINYDKLYGYNKIYLKTKINKNFNFNVATIVNANDKSKIIVDSDNASLVFKAFDIYRETNQGILHIEAIKNNSLNPINRNIIGNLNVYNFEATKTSIFSKIITITSVPGLLKLISGNTIPFNQLNMNLDIKNDRILISQSAINGNQMSISMEGEIDIKNQKLNIKGLLIPDLFSLNRIFSAVPLIGKILKGSNKEGVIALNYQITGALNKPNIWANPFSITPGIIKKLFNYFI